MCLFIPCSIDLCVQALDTFSNLSSDLVIIEMIFITSNFSSKCLGHTGQHCKQLNDLTVALLKL